MLCWALHRSTLVLHELSVLCFTQSSTTQHNILLHSLLHYCAPGGSHSTQNGPNHLGLWSLRLLQHKTALITSEWLQAAVTAAKAETAKPTMIKIRTVIGEGCPSKAGSHKVHGAPLGAAGIEEMKVSRSKNASCHCLSVMLPPS